jgi:cyclic pyranopterin phosphate synthase
MNDVEFPVARVLQGIDAAQAAGMPVKLNTVVKRGLNDGEILSLAEHFRGTGHVLRFIEYMDVGATNGWSLDEVVPRRRSSRRSMRASRSSPSPPPPRRDREALALRRRIRRDRRDLVGHERVLRHLQPRPALHRGTPVHVPVRDRGPRPARPAARGADDAELTATLARIWGVRDDRYSEIRASLTPSCAPTGTASR